uniref:Histidine--tRNA ligase, chloroplastic n=1 Tax=Tolypiocladia glomerulata TaxID=860646 RepID=A0A1Z1MVL7_9FLOR|nr:Histidine-tRNA ligase [Tolypiocladia glomerulata]ARW69835.1 Histidine-tRNA ligase [Tolypiocladia glomerulata]
MQPLRGTKDILPNDIHIWQRIYNISYNLLKNYGYEEIRTPLLERTELFERCIGNFTDIVNKEMYTFTDQNNRSITLRPEGTSSIARSIISNKIYSNNKMHRVWYMGPMFRYERPQKGRQRQFHQLGLECIGSSASIADIEVIKIANQILQTLNCINNCQLEINSIGNIQERTIYTEKLVQYLEKYEQELDEDSKQRINKNPLRILDSKNIKTQEILNSGPILRNYLDTKSLRHFDEVCDGLQYLNIDYKINDFLVRGLDYYNYTAFEIKTKENNQQNTICGGGRYDSLIKQIGGPQIPAVGWAIGIERLLILLKETQYLIENNKQIYIAIDNIENQNVIWNVIDVLEKYKLNFELDITSNKVSKKIKKAHQIGSKICLILYQNNMKENYIKIKWLKTEIEQKIRIENIREYLKYIKKIL